jgi:thioredoxin reductase (NADPH)
MSTTTANDAVPTLSDQQWARLKAYAVAQDVDAGALLFRAGDSSYDLIVIESGTVDVIRTETSDSAEAVVVTHGPGRFVGELSLLTGQATYLSARVAEAGRVYRVPPPAFRRLMDEDPELSDLILRALLARRQSLRAGEAARSIEILGSDMSAAALALRTYVARQQLPHMWVDIDTPAGAAPARATHVAPADLPVVITPTAVLRQATPGQLADELGLSYRPVAGEVLDLLVIGAGPAGLAASVYGASEGLGTLLLDSVAAGGQAAASSRIENYLGFTSGISGAELTGRAAVQAQKFGARIASPREVVRLETTGGHLRVVLTDDSELAARAVVIATGARYRSLPLPGWASFEGAGIYYAATELEARACGPNSVAVVGGANSAGQAALYLAGRGSEVSLIVRGDELAAGMSSYLADRIVAHQSITVRTSAEVIALRGEEHLEAITIRTTSPQIDPVDAEQECRGLFCFIGATPATDWLDGIAVDDHGFILTDTQLSDASLGTTWNDLGRRPLPFETSQPRVFATGDVRAGSMKRVAAAVGEGASAIRSIHTALGSVEA